jgi:murein DD-endopeptidase MepM/ murein hydrolase activator NlpD
MGLEIHHGIDLGASIGTPISPTAFGFISTIKKSEILGNYVVITHVLDFSSLYAHLSQVNTHKGSFVLPGISTIGLVGNTDRSTGPHLHFGISFLNIPFPPRLFLVFHSIRKLIFKM